MLSHLEMSDYQLDICSYWALVSGYLMIGFYDGIILDGYRGPLPCACASGLGEGYRDVVGVLVVHVVVQQFKSLMFTGVVTIIS